MKNNEQSILVFTTVLFAALMLGVFVGRLEANPFVPISSNSQADSPKQANTPKEQTTGKININTATAEQLTMLPGIGMTYAKRIVEYREKYGPFLFTKDITKVRGVGKTKYEAIKDYITVGE